MEVSRLQWREEFGIIDNQEHCCLFIKAKKNPHWLRWELEALRIGEKYYRIK